MESPPPPTPPSPVGPEAKTDPAARPMTESAGRLSAPASTEPTPSYPRPPALLPRLIMLCLRPETWAEMARYPSRFTYIPLVLAILMAALGVGIAGGVRLLNRAEQFAGTYDAKYPPLELTSAGVLSATREFAGPIRFDASDTGAMILVDPTGKTLPASIKTGETVLITDKEIWLFLQPEAPMLHGKIADYPAWLPAAGTTQRIDGSTMKAFFGVYRNPMIVATAMFSGGQLFVSSVLWAILMVFLISPLVTLAAAGGRAPAAGGEDRRLLIPRRAAHRIAAAVLIPLVVLDGALNIAGKPVTSLLGSEAALVFWFFSAGALCVWAGMMARGMYGEAGRGKTQKNKG